MKNVITVTGGDMIFIWAYLRLPQYAVIMHSIDIGLKREGKLVYAGIDEYLIAYFK